VRRFGRGGVGAISIATLGEKELVLMCWPAARSQSASSQLHLSTVNHPQDCLQKTIAAYQDLSKCSAQYSIAIGLEGAFDQLFTADLPHRLSNLRI
jgi:hypothetical protein